MTETPTSHVENDGEVRAERVMIENLFSEVHAQDDVGRNKFVGKLANAVNRIKSSGLAGKFHGKSQWAKRAEDRQFVESFKNYVDLLVKESCREINGEGHVSSEDFSRAGAKLIEKGKAAGISAEVERFVGVLNDLAGNGMLAPLGSGATSHTPSGNSIHDSVKAMGGLRNYFDGVGLTLSEGLDRFEDRYVVHVCLGEADIITLPAEPEVVIFKKTVIGKTGDTIRNEVLGSGGYSDWTDRERIYQLLEPKIENGKRLLSDMKKRSFVKIANSFIGKEHALPKRDKLDEVAWMHLFGDEWNFLFGAGCGDFAKIYAACCIEYNYNHEVYHRLIDKCDGDPATKEAAAELHAMRRGGYNSFYCLRELYWWKNDSKVPILEEAADVAFRYLEDAGYGESFWTELDTKNAKTWVGGGFHLHEVAESALKNIERDMGWGVNETHALIDSRFELHDKLEASYGKYYKY